MKFKNIKQLEKEIEIEEKIFGTLDAGAQKRLRKDFERATKTERLFIIENLKAKIQTLQNVCEEIKKFKGEEYTDFEIWEEIREIFLRKFQGEENEK